MNRRDVLRAAGGAFALAALGGRPAAAHPGPYRPLGSIDVPGAKEAVVNEDGSIVYLAVTDGFAVVDISTPSRMEVLAERRGLLADRDDGPMQEIYDVKYESDRLVAAGPANPKRGEVVKGFLLYDVSDPANPTQLAFHETEFPIHNCFLRDGIVYLTGNNGAGNPLVMVDVSGGTPEEVGRWSMLDVDEAWAEVDPFLRTIHDVYVQDGTTYLVQWDAGTWIVDVSDPANPQYEAHVGGLPRSELRGMEARPQSVELPGNAHYATVNDDASLLAVGAEAWDSPDSGEVHEPGGIDLWTLPKLGDPEKVATIEAPPTPDPSLGGTWTTSHNFDLAGDRLYSSWYQGGVKIHDVSDPANPEELAWWRQPEEAAFWTAQSATVTTGPSLEEEGVFVASSYGVDAGIGEGLYAFPDEAGQQKNPPPLTPGDETESTTQAASGGGTGGTQTESAGAVQETTNESGQPGFGVLAALGGLTVGALRYLGREE